MLIRQLLSAVIRYIGQIFLVGNHGEDQPGHISGNQQARNNQAQHICIALGNRVGVKEHGRNKEGDDCHDHQ
ncbi:hypothetical protein D3C80_1687870 [compost metagenome]